MLITGLTKHAIKSAREKSWLEGREYRYYSGDCQPKDNSPILYNRLKLITGLNVSSRLSLGQKSATLQTREVSF